MKRSKLNELLEEYFITAERKAEILKTRDRSETRDAFSVAIGKLNDRLDVLSKIIMIENGAPGFYFYDIYDIDKKKKEDPPVIINIKSLVEKVSISSTANGIDTSELEKVITESLIKAVHAAFNNK